MGEYERWDIQVTKEAFLGGDIRRKTCLSSGYYGKSLQTGWLKPQTLTSISLEAGMPND
jgi:hypothetical protein